MNILLISGSPRKQGNTARFLRQLADELTGDTVSMVSLSDFPVNGCLGCSACQENLEEPGCIQKDETAGLLRRVMEADAVVYGTPLYGHSYSGQLKLLMDRHVALFKFVGGADKAVNEMDILSFIKDKPMALVVSCQGPEENNTELIKLQFDKFCESSLARCVGKYVFPLCAPNVPGPVCDAARIRDIVSDLHSAVSVPG